MSVLFACSKSIDDSLLRKLSLDGNVSLLDENPYLPLPEATHADMQILTVKDSLFVKKGVCRTFIGDLEKISKRAVISGQNTPQKYPECCSHNVLVCGNYYFHNTKVTDENVKKYLEDYFYVPVDVKQGYSGCSSCYIDSLDLIITSDPGIMKASSKHSFNCYFVSSEITENIKLEGYDHGFIGGCLGYFKEKNTLYVSGSLKENVPELYELLRQANVTVIESEKKELTDIGGIKCIVYK